MAVPQPITAIRRPEAASYVGNERRGQGAPQLGVSAARVRLGALAMVSITAAVLHLIGARPTDSAIGTALPPCLAGVPFAAAILYCLRFMLLRDAFSLHIGITTVCCSVATGTALV